MHICDERSTTVVVQCKFMVSHILDQCPLADAHIGYMDMQELVSAVLCCAVLCCAVHCTVSRLWMHAHLGPRTAYAEVTSPPPPQPIARSSAL